MHSLQIFFVAQGMLGQTSTTQRAARRCAAHLPGVGGGLVADVIHGAIAGEGRAGQGGACSSGPCLWLIQLRLGQNVPEQMSTSALKGHSCHRAGGYIFPHQTCSKQHLLYLRRQAPAWLHDYPCLRLKCCSGRKEQQVRGASMHLKKASKAARPSVSPVAPTVHISDKSTAASVAAAPPGWGPGHHTARPTISIACCTLHDMHLPMYAGQMLNHSQASAPHPSPQEELAMPRVTFAHAQLTPSRATRTAWPLRNAA